MNQIFNKQDEFDHDDRLLLSILALSNNELLNIETEDFDRLKNRGFILSVDHIKELRLKVKHMIYYDVSMDYLLKYNQINDIKPAIV